MVEWLIWEMDEKWEVGVVGRLGVWKHENN